MACWPRCYIVLQASSIVLYTLLQPEAAGVGVGSQLALHCPLHLKHREGCTGCWCRQPLLQTKSAPSSKSRSMLFCKTSSITRTRCVWQQTSCLAGPDPLLSEASGCIPPQLNLKSTGSVSLFAGWSVDVVLFGELYQEANSSQQAL